MSLFLSFMNNTKIQTKIFIGFGIVLALLLVISATGGVSLQSGESNFTQYREQAALSNRAAMVQATLQKAQLAITSPNRQRTPSRNSRIVFPRP